MRLINHIVTDFSLKKNHNSTHYWVLHFLNNNSSKPLFLENKIFLLKIKKKPFKNRIKILNNNKFDLKFNNVFHINLKNWSKYFLIQGNLTNYNTLINIVNTNFLRKERLYTKLKYSRSPAYDIVSGGIAALFAGLLGFLVSEKFGFELVDSGDFYYIFMYFVFIAFSLRPLVIISNSKKSFWYTINPKRVLEFYINLIGVFLNKIK